MNDVYAVLLAGGSGERMGENKLLMRFGGMSVLERSLRALQGALNAPQLTVIASGETSLAEAERLAAGREDVIVTKGGETRTLSVLNALRALGQRRGVAVIHDAARCLVTGEIIDASIETARDRGAGVAAIPVRDTLRHGDGVIAERDGLLAVQTPQSFRMPDILEAYEAAAASAERFTDDLGVWLKSGREAAFSKGSLMNQKLTYKEDIDFFSAATDKPRIGFGEDTHRLVEGRKLVLGGVELAFEKGLLGHSDADVLSHAVIDAMLGAAALGDIGRHFPDTDERYRGICSIELLKATAALIKEHGFTVSNIDATVSAERPKLAPYIERMRENIALAVGADISRVSVKATTTETMNDEGRGLCITARAVCTVL